MTQPIVIVGGGGPLTEQIRKILGDAGHNDVVVLDEPRVDRSQLAELPDLPDLPGLADLVALPEFDLFREEVDRIVLERGHPEIIFSGKSEQFFGYEPICREPKPPGDWTNREWRRPRSKKRRR